jgi:hypothetical protein
MYDKRTSDIFTARSGSADRQALPGRRGVPHGIHLQPLGGIRKISQHSGGKSAADLSPPGTGIVADHASGKDASELSEQELEKVAGGTTASVVYGTVAFTVTVVTITFASQAEIYDVW